MTSVCMSVDMCLLDPFSPRKSYKSFFNSFIEVGLKYKTKLHTGAKAGTQETLNVIHRCLTLIVVIVSRVKAFVHTHQTVYINSLPISIYKTELFLRMREVLLPLEASHLEITEASLNGSGGRIVRIGIHQPSDLLFFFLKIIGTEDAKNASSSSASPSYSGIILPVVIALIVVTLSAFVLVGLYRMCWKTDPGTPENGNDQPQSDKESVKLLTVKTISHESGLIFSFYAPGIGRETQSVDSILTSSPALQSVPVACPKKVMPR
uniref:Endomucin n=1 Tax=Ursus americanus TaxID=9643 RepID=A0A452QW24_URSAM